jgi:SAM-dependent methyltransferase
MPYNFIYKDCNICNSKNRIFLGKRIPRAYSLDNSLITDIVRCADCGLIYPYPMPYPDGDQVAKNYSNPESYFPADISEGRLKFYESILNKVERFSGGKGRLLDIGCGRGELLFVAKRYGWEVSGVDVSKDFADYARNKFDIEVAVGDIKEMNFELESFDVITLIAVLDHVHDPQGLVSALSRLLRKGGIVFIETMNNESILYKLGDMYYGLTGKKITTNLSPTFPSFQVYGFSKKSMSRLLKAAGFKEFKILIRGGISRTEKFKAASLQESVLRLFRGLCFVIANLLNKGQVLEACARKEV